METDILIVGAGHGGAQAAIALRQLGIGCAITMVGDEPHLPYERPPLSKEYLAGKKPFERLLIRPPHFWNDRAVDIRTGTRIVAIDAAGHRATTADGASIGYRAMIWAAGGQARRLRCPGHECAGVHVIRSRGDIDALLGELPGTQRVAVIGGGYIGLEAAAVLSTLGKAVTVVEAQDRVLARVAGADLSRFFEDEHRRQGVTLRLGATVAAIETRDGRAAGVRLADGAVIAADMVIVGIGIDPVIAPLAAAGADVGDGVEVDPQCRTLLPDIYAIGDCARHGNRFAGGARLRLESVQNAHDMAAVAASCIAGQPRAYDAVPWFWSNQYDIKLQTVGLSAGHDAAVVRGDPAARSFSVIYLREGRVVALDCVNAVRDYVQGRALVTGGTAADPRVLADPGVALKTLA